MNFNLLRVILFIAICNGPTSYAQLAEIDSPRHIKGQQGIEGNIGITKLGRFFNLGYSRNFTNKIYGKVQLGIESGNYRKNMFNFLSYTGDLGVYYAPVNIKRTVFIGVNGGLSVTSDQVKGNDIDDITFMNYGVFAGTEAEFFLSDNFVILATFKQKFLLQQQYGTQVYFAGIGLKYVFLKE